MSRVTGPSSSGLVSPLFRKLTPVNGFDTDNPDNAKQNNYAWSMSEMDGYLYVGTGRNIVYSVLKSGIFGDIPVPPIFVPERLDMNAEIWRFKEDCSGEWERVFKAPPELGITGFRFMIRYTTPLGETALYAGCATLQPEVLVLKSTDGRNWIPLLSGIPGNSTRAMVIHGGKLYMGVLGGLTTLGKTRLYVSADPEREGWQLVDVSGDPNKNPRGDVVTMLSFNQHLYVATAPPGGFELWRTMGSVPVTNEWKLVVDKGAGDALNEIPLSIGAFNDHVYVGTAIAFAIVSVDPNKRFVPPKGFDLIRVDRDDRWELVVGGPPIAPTEPLTGNRGIALGGCPSGFGNITNAYCWQIQAQGRELYVGSFDWAVVAPPILSVIGPVLRSLFPYDLDNYVSALRSYLAFLLRTDPFLSLFPVELALQKLFSPLLRIVEETFGFDMWKSFDGVRWFPVSLDGLGNPYNYGLRNIFLSSSGTAYLGTANPFQGCEVWLKRPNPLLTEEGCVPTPAGDLLGLL